MTAFGKAVLRRFVIGCVAFVAVAIALSGLRQTTFHYAPIPAVPAASTASTVAACDELIATGAVETCQVVDEAGTLPGGGR